MNDMLTSEEFEYMLSDSGARAVVVGDGFTETVADLEPELPDLNLVVAVDEAPPDGQIRLVDVLERSDSEPLDVDISPDDLLRLSYTGGTTSRPRALVTPTESSR